MHLNLAMAGCGSYAFGEVIWGNPKRLEPKRFGAVRKIEREKKRVEVKR